MSLKLHILSILSRVPPAGMPLTALKAELGMVTSGPVGDTDLEQALSELKRKGQISEGRHEVTDDRTFCIPAPEPQKKKGRKG